MNLHEDGRKRALPATVVKVLRHRREDRGMSLEPHPSRCIRAGEVHELVTTDHHETATGSRIDRVGFLGFAEFGSAGVLDRGDELRIGDRLIGIVLGFDACHYPNHYNILVRTETPRTGEEIGLRPEMALTFNQALVRA